MITDRHLPDVRNAADWRDNAACLDLDDPNAMFPSPTDVLSIEDAKSICRACPVLAECRRVALERGETYGVWGGLDEAERDRLLGRRRRLRDPAAPPRTLRARCGTEAGHKRHVRQGTRPCGWCKDAYNAARAERRRAKQQQPQKPSGPKLAPCGTRAAYQRHLKRGEPVDAACRQANTDADNRLRRTGTTKRVAA